MLTVSQKVDELINYSPYLKEALSDRLINLSSLARKLKPQIEKSLMKDVTEGAILVALQRYSASLKPYYHTNPAHFLKNLSLRSDLYELTVKNSPTLLNKLTEVGNHIEENFASVFIFTRGMFETSIITSIALKEEIEAALEGENILKIVPDLTGISLQRTHGQIERTGVLYFPVRILAWEEISVIEIITTLNEIMLIVMYS